MHSSHILHKIFDQIQLQLQFFILNPCSLNNSQYCKWGAFLVNFGPINHQFEIVPHFFVKYLPQYQFIFWRALHMYAKDWSALIDLMSMSWEGGGSREWIMKYEWLVYPSSHLSLRTRKKGFTADLWLIKHVKYL